MVEGGKLGADFVGGAERSSCRSRCCILASVGVGKGGNRRTVSTSSIKSPGREGGKGEEAVASNFFRGGSGGNSRRRANRLVFIAPHKKCLVFLGF